MRTTLIIGAGGVSRVVVYKCVQNADVFGRIVLASRTLKRCQDIKEELPNADIEVASV
ncbi:MAG: saccharopine dehydrogenase NADP-binding domain-containing protein, partial [Sulfurimonas sp.]|nr:saccharopine dehydrogenase NADP-binding domain-containing protein [Sulfurimonas sp.]